MSRIVETPKPPYYAVIAPAELAGEDLTGYAKMAERLMALAVDQPGFLGIETALSGSFVLGVSYWESLEAIDGWRRSAVHQGAKGRAKDRWFERYFTRIARVEADY